MTEPKAEPAAEANPLRANLPRGQAIDPCAIVLFGATGDLFHRKLAPALFHLAAAGALPPRYSVVGVARRDWTDEQFRGEVEPSLSKNNGADFQRTWPEFAGHVFFSGGTFDDPATYEALKARLDELDKTQGTGGNRLFYLAVAPEFFLPIVEQLGKSGLISQDPHQGPWTRVVIEKPFGHDLQSARDLSRDVARVLDESQTYRIDHYLGKETVQNILALRFGNAIFEAIWNRRHVESVQITVAEEVAVGGRGAFYDEAGAIRDLVQNHILQVLCLVAMEPPVNLSADAVRTEKVKVLQALPRWSAEEVDRHVVRAQYTAGSIQGREVPDYHAEKGVKPDSTTETYVALRLTLNNWRWAGVPFYLRTGKALPKRTTEIAIQFRNPPTNLFEPDVEGSDHVNQLILLIPAQGGDEPGLPGQDPRLAPAPPAGADGFSVRDRLRHPVPRGVRAAAAGCDPGGSDAVHPDRRGGQRMAVHHADPGRLAPAGRAQAGEVCGRDVGARGGGCADRGGWGAVAAALRLVRSR